MGSPVFAGALLGLSNAFEQEHKEKFDTEMNYRKGMSQMYLQMAADPNQPQDARAEYFRRGMGITQVPFGKKLPSQWLKPYERPVQAAQPAPQGNAAASPPPSPAGAQGGGQGPTPGVLQGGANQIPSPPPAPPSGLPGGVPLPGVPEYATPPPSPGGTAPYVGPSALDIAQTEARKAGMATGAQTEAQLTSRYQAFIKMGMDPSRAAMMASGMAGMMKPSGVNVLLDDGTHAAATKVFDPTDYRYHYYVGSNDVTDHVTGTAISAAQQTAWPKGDLASVQLVPNGPKYLATDPNIPPEAKAWFEAQRQGKTRTTGATTTPTLGGGTVTKRTTGPAAPSGSAAPPAPPGGTATAQPRAAATFSKSVGFKTGNPQVDWATMQVAADPKNWQIAVGNDKALAQKVRTNLARLGLDINQPDAGVRRMAGIARAVLPKLYTVEAELNDPAIASQLGAFSSRWENWKRGGLGAGADPKFVKLFNDIGFLQTGTMIAHTGRTPIAILDKFVDMLNAKKMDAETLKAGLSSFKDTLEQYQKMVPRGSELQGGGTVDDEIMRAVQAAKGNK